MQPVGIERAGAIRRARSRPTPVDLDTARQIDERGLRSTSARAAQPAGSRAVA